MKKLIVRGGLVLIVLVIVGLVALYFSINSIIKNVVEDQGQQATGVQTTLQKVNLNPFGGKLDLNNFLLHNPEGFSDANIFTIGDADVQVQLGTLLSGDEVVVPRFAVDGATVMLELNGAQLNALKLLENIQGQGQAGDTGTDGQEPAPDADGQTRGYLIRDLSITNTKVVGRLRLPGGVDQDVNITLAPIQQKDVRGVEMADIIGFVVQTVMINASKEAIDVVPNLDQLEGQLNDVAGQVIGNVGGKVDQVVPGAGKAVEDKLGQEAGKALNDLFGGKKKAEEKPAE